MTPLPKRRISKARQGKRRASIKLGLPSLITCECGVSKKMHCICPGCGMYKGKEVKGKSANRQTETKDKEK